MYNVGSTVYLTIFPKMSNLSLSLFSSKQNTQANTSLAAIVLYTEISLQSYSNELNIYNIELYVTILWFDTFLCVKRIHDTRT